jgi:urease accessory protein
MLRRQQLVVTEALSPFEPEGGAYDTGAGHAHGHGHGHSHSHDHDHEH